jgi:hypothetical protein
MIFLDLDNCPFRYEHVEGKNIFPFIIQHFVQFSRNYVISVYNPPYRSLHSGEIAPDYKVTLELRHSVFGYEGSCPSYLDGKDVMYPAKGLAYDLRSCFD